MEAPPEGLPPSGGEGQPAKLAVVVVMRKLVILANVLVRDDRNWQSRA